MVQLVECDYRDLEGTFDRLVSVEMIEAVDWRDVPGYFATCAQLLKPDGLMGLQDITAVSYTHLTPFKAPRPQKRSRPLRPQQ